MSTLSAKVAKIDIRIAVLDGLLGEDGEFYVAVPQVSGLLQFANEHASRDIKALLGKGFQFAKFKTSLHPKAVNAIPLAKL